MKKILIVDDEYLVRLGIKTTVDWARHGYSVVGEAKSGEEALSLFAETNPDILLTDIKMAGMDGLTLIARLKAQKPSLHAVILTHYDDFAYAKRAVNLGAAEYLLKSELSEETLLATLRRLPGGGRADTEGAGGPVQPLAAYLRQCLAYPRFHRAYPAPEGVPPFEGEALAISCYCGLHLTDQSPGAFSRGVQEMLERAWPDTALCTTRQGGALRAMLLLPLPRAGGAQAAAAQLRRTVLNIRQYYEVEFQAGISLPGGLARLPAMLSEAEAACGLCFFSPDAPCLTFEGFPPSDAPPPAIDHALLRERVHLSEWAPLREVIAGVFDALRAGQSLEAVRTAYLDLLSFARLLAAQGGGAREGILAGEKLSYRSFEMLSTLSTARDFMLDIYRSLFIAAAGADKRYSRTINRCVEYIHGHYAENIALSDAADAVGISKSYLSVLFKQETGINFSKYLMDYRVERAKALLRETNLKVYEVAQQVGFLNPYYFSKVFKDTTGISCKEYKNAPE